MRDSPPDARVKVAQPDHIVATTQALAVTAALHHRARTGQGQFIEIAQVEATVASLTPAYLDYFATGTVAVPKAIVTLTRCRRAATLRGA